MGNARDSEISRRTLKSHLRFSADKPSSLARHGTRLALARVEVTIMDPNSIDKAPRKDRNEDEEFVPGPLDDPSEADDDSNESIEDPDADDEERDSDEGID
jgi:hypothetical protein